MRFETAGSIGSLAVLALLAVFLRPAERQEVEKAISCQREIALIDYWKTMNLIRDEKQQGEDVEIVVYGRGWAALPHTSQLEIGAAAYCRVGVKGKGGVARIVDLNGEELGRVVAGKWLE